jgi:F-type H+-transporting ATPase subunit alpha
VTHKYLTDINVEKSLEFENELLKYIETKHPEIFIELREKGDLGEELKKNLQNVMEQFKKEIKI